MNEDLKPLYDVKSAWELVHAKRPTAVYKHKECDSLFRIINFNLQEVTFNDTLMVPPANVIDIYRPLALKEKAEIMGIILKVMHEIKPITMPYIHEEYKVYVEKHKEVLGILYFKDNDEEESIVPIKRFFNMTRDPILNIEEISWNRFRELAEEEEESHVDQT